MCARLGVEWGGDFSPLSDLHLALLLKRSYIEWEYVPMTGVVEVVWPPAFGLHQLQLAKDQHAGARRFALRHGLGHVLAGHTELAGSADDGHHDSFEERVADLFAIVDVIPTVKLDELAAAGYNELEIERWCYGELARWTDSWPGERLRDRVRLRLEMEGL